MTASLKSWVMAVLGIAGCLSPIDTARAYKPNAETAATERADAARWARLAQRLDNQHPVKYYERAIELFAQGRRDDAVFLYYLGQLRWRVYLDANPTLPPDGDAAIFASLSDMAGSIINEYAGGDIPTWARIMQAVLDYDRAHPDRFTAKTATPQVRDKIRKGLAELRDHVLAQAGTFRAERAKQGLENRN